MCDMRIKIRLTCSMVEKISVSLSVKWGSMKMVKGKIFFEVNFNNDI